jgi:predicted N-acetyltransferase YhbS
VAYTRPEPLRGKHGTERFDSGEPSLDSWLKKHARLAEAGGSVRVYVAIEDGAEVVGFYALSAASVHPDDASERLSKGQGRHPVPVVLISRLAVDARHQGKGLGRSLLQDITIKATRAASYIGARAIVVDALSAEVAGFYERFGFEPSPTDPRHLILLMKDVRAMIDKVVGAAADDARA